MWIEIARSEFSGMRRPPTRRSRSSPRVRVTLGYTVEAATRGVGALAAFRAAPEAFDLVVTDRAAPRNLLREIPRRIEELRPRPTPVSAEEIHGGV
jgi:CheY-like chemotaxis protein